MKLNLFIVTSALVFCLVGSESDADDCPNPELVQPCHCDREGLSCYNEITEDTLAKVFQVNSKYKAYRSVWIIQNPIKQLPPNVFNRYRVSTFRIEENELEIVNDGAFSGSYPLITEMSLYKNNISYFPFQELLLMTKLQKLTFASNKLRTIPANSFSLAPSLTQIDLSKNEIESIAPGAFFGMKNLQLILLTDNKLEKIPALAFGSIEQRFQVDLSGNSINYVDPAAFSGSLPAFIDLTGNQLTFLDPKVFNIPVSTYNTVLVVSDNPFTCRGCSNYKWLLSTRSQNIVGFKCSSGRELSELNLLEIGCFFV